MEHRRDPYGPYKGQFTPASPLIIGQLSTWIMDTAQNSNRTPCMIRMTIQPTAEIILEGLDK